LKNWRRICFILTAILLAILSTILISGLALRKRRWCWLPLDRQCRQPLYVLWGDESTSVHPESSFRYLAVGTSESARMFFSGAGILAAVMRHSQKAVERGGVRALELPTVWLVFGLLQLCQAARQAFAFPGQCCEIYLGKQPHGATRKISRLNPEVSFRLRSRCFTAQTEKGQTQFFPTSF